MPNHFHILNRIKAANEITELIQKKLASKAANNLEGKIDAYISQQFSNLFNSYTKSYNKMYDLRGSLFQPNFKRIEVSNNAYLMNIIQYIHANPVHHKFTDDMYSWEWSSYHSILSTKKTKCCGLRFLNYLEERQS